MINASPQLAIGTEPLLAVVRAWLEAGGAAVVEQNMEKARAAADAMVQDMDVPAHILDAPVTY